MEIVCIIWDRTEREDVGRVWTSEKHAHEPSYNGRDTNNVHSPEHHATMCYLPVA